MLLASERLQIVQCFHDSRQASFTNKVGADRCGDWALPGRRSGPSPERARRLTDHRLQPEIAHMITTMDYSYQDEDAWSDYSTRFGPFGPLLTPNEICAGQLGT